MEDNQIKVCIFKKGFRRLLISQQVTEFCDETQEAQRKLLSDERAIRKDWEASGTLQLGKQQNNGKLNSNR